MMDGRVICVMFMFMVVAVGELDLYLLARWLLADALGPPGVTNANLSTALPSACCSFSLRCRLCRGGATTLHDAFGGLCCCLT